MQGLASLPRVSGKILQPLGGAVNMRKYRQRLKNDESKLQEAKQAEKMRSRRRRQSMTEGDKLKYRELSKIRMRRYRERKKKCEAKAKKRGEISGLENRSKMTTRADTQKFRSSYKNNVRKKEKLNVRNVLICLQIKGGRYGMKTKWEWDAKEKKKERKKRGARFKRKDQRRIADKECTDILSSDRKRDSHAVVAYTRIAYDHLTNVRKLPLVRAVQFTDGRSAQCKSKKSWIFLFQDKILVFPQNWHGKGPCDGEGGVVKKAAERAVKSGNCVIIDAATMFKVLWSKLVETCRTGWYM